MKIAKVYSITRWYAKCPGCRRACHVKDDAPPFHPERVVCGFCQAVFEADLDEAIAERERLERLAKKPPRSSEW